MALSRLARAEPKAMRFGNAAELAIRVHWALYPESKPKGKERRRGAQGRALYSSGAQGEMVCGAVAGGQAHGRLLARRMAGAGALRQPPVPERIKDASTLFTDELIDEVNKFDRGAIEAQARALAL
ncbi:MAG TPA: hypothetical protein VEM36_10850 [Xanthobacteraceae bacterium]|nr:hypothetical protein [Xanthobacteraceae bacterium]